jgi:ribose transport system permease protein
MKARWHASSLSRSLLKSDHFVLLLSLICFISAWLAFPSMIRPRNLSNLSSDLWPLLTLVIGQMFVLIVGGIDLSQTAIMGLTSVLGGIIMTTHMNPDKFAGNPLWGTLLSESGGCLGGHALAVPAALLVMLSAGLTIGLLNGMAVAKLKMPPFMVTLVSMSFFSGLAIYLTQSENLMYLPDSFIAIGREGLGPVPYAFPIALALGATAYVILDRTLLGRWLYATGKNRKTALISGVPTERVIILAYMFSGTCAATGSILYSARLQAGRPTLGQNDLLDIIGAAVIGGISLFGGKGKVRCALYGVLFFVVLENALNKTELKFYTLDIIKGAVILLAALLDVVRNRWLAAPVLPPGGPAHA